MEHSAADNSDGSGIVQRKSILKLAIVGDLAISPTIKLMAR
jgi:hypothetical protein